MTTLPALYISHGSPMIALEPGPAGAFLQRLGPAVDAAFGRPRAIVVASAHSLTREPVLLAAARHAAVYDFGGFDPALYTLRYDAPGAPALASQVQMLLRDAGMPAHRVDEGGLDHGIWTPLRYAFPDADIPLLPLAWPPDWTPARLYALGAALAPLAADGVLVVGSGSITHNMRHFHAARLRGSLDPALANASRDFRDWFAARSAAADWTALFDYRRAAPHAVEMHPTDEHLLPFFIAAGAGGGAPGVRLHDSTAAGELGMDTLAFGPTAPALAERIGAAPN